MKTVRMEFDNLRDIYSHFEILSASQHLVDRAGSLSEMQLGKVTCLFHYFSKFVMTSHGNLILNSYQVSSISLSRDMMGAQRPSAFHTPSCLKKKNNLINLSYLNFLAINKYLFGPLC